MTHISSTLTDLFNHCIEIGSIPAEWKFSIVLPLFKKGKIDDCNNYRGISLLSPIAKIFETLLADQVGEYFEKNNLFHPCQHGFRKNYSCETALHEIISELNNAKDKRLIALLLFIDFRKAFDTVDAKLLLNKLFHYGFDNLSIKLLSDYFSNRAQVVRLGNVISGKRPIRLGVPQGSVFGPLLFLIFINDLAFIIALLCKLFADDTTLYATTANSVETLDNLIADFVRKLGPLFKWCAMNRMDINWSKTFFMIVTAKQKRKISVPTFIKVGSNEVAVADNFKLLGVLIDNKLTFKQHVTNICINVNRKLFSIKRLAYLPFLVRLQFFKTFILPIFDYCLSLICYFSKTQVQRLANCYNACLFKLFRFDFSSRDLDEINNTLVEYKLFGFQHRVVLRLSLFAHKLINVPAAPVKLKEQFLFNSKRNLPYNLRNVKTLCVPHTNNHYGKITFQYFFNMFVEKICISHINSPFIDFRSYFLNNLKTLCNKFVDIFEKFDIAYKKTFFINYQKKKIKNTDTK